MPPWLNVATPTARNLVRKIIKDAAEPLHTQEIYLRSQRDFPLPPEEQEAQREIYVNLLRRKGPPPPTNLKHDIRSVKYLKNVVLADLEQRDEIVKVHHLRPPTPEEREAIKNRGPLSRAQRLGRRVTGPGKQLPRLTSGGLVSEWVWRFKIESDFEREARLEERKREVARQKQEEKQEAARRKQEARLKLRKVREKASKL